MHIEQQVNFTSQHDIRRLTDNEPSKHMGYTISNNKLKVIPDGVVFR